MQYPEGHSNSVDQVGLSAPQFSQQPPTSLQDELKTEQLQHFFCTASAHCQAHTEFRAASSITFRVRA